MKLTYKPLPTTRSHPWVYLDEQCDYASLVTLNVISEFINQGTIDNHTILLDKSIGDQINDH